ncbi:MAG: response regulator, partial [Rhizobiaceae bacterium]
LNKNPVRFMRFNNEPAQMSIHEAKDGHQVEIIENTASFLNLEARALKAEREASAMDRLKQVTMSRLSHTIRTPMTGVLAAAELLSETELDDKQRARLDLIRRSAGTLLGVVQDMFDLADATTQALNDGSPRRKQALVCAAPAELALQTSEILGARDYDVTMFETPTHASAVTDAWHKVKEKQASLIVVADEEQKKRLLAMNGRAVEFDKTEIKLFSELLFQEENPQTVEEPQAATPERTLKSLIAPEQLDLLIIESNEVNQIYLGNNLENSGYMFKIVGTGAAALDVVKAENPRLILTDISVPDIDGLQITSSIRNSQHGTSYVPIIIGMAKHFVQGDSAKCLKVGMDHYMAKPQTGPDLISMLNGWLKPEQLKKAS